MEERTRISDERGGAALFIPESAGEEIARISGTVSDQKRKGELWKKSKRRRHTDID